MDFSHVLANIRGSEENAFHDIKREFYNNYRNQNERPKAATEILHFLREPVKGV